MQTTNKTTYEPVIGLETHVQLQTRSKMFCSCSADYAGAEPNTHVCPVCLALPGTLPVINKQAVDYALMTGLALNCSNPEATKFDRKNYPYPDLLKGYQISQYDLPFSVDGWLTLDVDGQPRRVGITRAHLEEDTAKLIHRNENGTAYSLLDVNRSGVPLMEVVSEPDMRSPAEARAYLQKMRLIVQTLGVSTGNMEEGAMRCDVNISLRPAGAEAFGVKVEIKNLNSARSVQRALEYEIERQTRLLERGERVIQETRGWDDDRGTTVSQRSKEEAHDYRYFPEPDLPPVFVSHEWLAELRNRLPELPDARRERYMRDFELSHYDAVQLTSSRAISQLFETVVALYPKPKIVANWIEGEVFRTFGEGEFVTGLDGRPRFRARTGTFGVGLPDGSVETTTSTSFTGLSISPEHLAELLTLVEEGTISQATGKQLLEEVARTGQAPRALAAERGLAQISNTDELEQAVAQAIAANSQAVADYHAGKAQAMGFLTGQVMKATRGKANPAVVNEILKRQLGG